MPSGIYVRSEKHKKNISIAQRKIVGFGKWNRGIKKSEESKKKIGLAFKGDKNHQWKGNDVGYRGLHHWVNKWKKKPPVCEHCGEIKNRMSWANIDHKYRRVLEDYIFLCPKCHGIYDKLNNLRKHKCLHQKH